MTRLQRISIGILTWILILGSIGCGKAQKAEKTDNTTSAEPAGITSADPVSLTELDTAVEDSPGKVWLVPSEAECPAASRADAPLVMTVENVSPTQATLTLRAKDRSRFDVGYEPRYGIERFEENGWVGVGPDRAFPEPYYHDTARQEYRETVELEENGMSLNPGYYRLNKAFSTMVNGEPVTITYYAYFEIGE
ncbi:MAG: hypothetical protein IJW99_09630 [Clostridia bacterium]|nr:hypothetical protein [Clostridia bacterium]